MNLLVDQETGEFSQMQNTFESRLLAGPESLAEAGAILSEIESRNWINNYRTQIMQMKAEKSGIERVYSSLMTVTQLMIAPEITPGIIIGSVTSQKALTSPEPSEIAASSMEGLIWLMIAVLERMV